MTRLSRTESAAPGLRPAPQGKAHRPRLAGREARFEVDAQPSSAQPLQGEADPRWVLAIRTAEKLEGPLLPPEQRQRLIRLGRLMGLSPFDCNLVIAIVQDQARRGHAAAYCPTAAQHQLQMVPLPRHAGVIGHLRERPVLFACLILTGLILLEVILLGWLL